MRQTFLCSFTSSSSLNHSTPILWMRRLRPHKGKGPAQLWWAAQSWAQDPMGVVRDPRPLHGAPGVPPSRPQARVGPGQGAHTIALGLRLLPTASQLPGWLSSIAVPRPASPLGNRGQRQAAGPSSLTTPCPWRRSGCCRACCSRERVSPRSDAPSSATQAFSRRRGSTGG